jgi:AcrR family transcriptional regulator
MDAPNTALKITQAARKLLDRGGAEGVTMRRVAQKVGITPMAIYRHFPDRAALLNALADEGFEELAAWLAGQRLTGDVEERLYRMGDLYLEHALEHPKLFELMFLKPREGARQYPRDFKARKSPTGNLMAETVQAAMDSGYFKQDDAWEITFEMGALSHGLIMLYLGGRLSTTVADFRALYRRSFRRYIHGIRA